MRQTPKPYGDRKNHIFFTYHSNSFQEHLSGAISRRLALVLVSRLTAKCCVIFFFFNLGELPARTAGVQVGHNFPHFFSITIESSEKQQKTI